VTVSGADSVRVRVHLYERCFRRKPVKVVSADEVHVGVTHDTGGALGDVTDEARFCRTAVTCIWGVSDPSFEAQNLDRRVAGGVAHAPDVSCTVADSRADCDTGGTKRRPTHRSEIAHSQGHRPIDLYSTNVHAAARFDGEPHGQKGEHSSRVCVPPVFRQSK
jgi:hypothetical protein